LLRLTITPPQLNTHLNQKKLIPLLLIGVFFLFFGKSNAFELRSFEALWNLGHILITFIAAIIINNNWPYFKNSSIWKQLLLISGIIFIIGGIVEILQSKMGRDASWDDLFLDVLGAITAIAFLSNQVKSLNSLFKWTRNIIFLILFSYALTPLISDGTDEIIQLSQFPVLSNFETPFEIKRWDVNVKSRSTKQFRSGQHSLKTEVAKYKYQGASLSYFDGDWSQYKTFNISIYNTLDHPVKFSVKIYDAYHKKYSTGYNDRFNRSIILKQGWNDIKLSTKEIQHGPKKRVMNLTNIRAVTIFPLKNQKPFFIYIDDVYLK